MQITQILTLITLIIISLSCKKDENETVETNTTGTQSGTLKLMFQNTMTMLDGNKGDLVLEDTVYKTGNGDTLSFSKFKYFISNVKLVNDSGDTTIVDESYHLVESTTMMAMSSFDLEIPEGDYKTIIFSLGVDSKANMDETIIEGDLDPNSNMVWNWKVGYKFLLFEGVFNHTSINDKFIYHIGQNANYTTYVRTLPKTLQVKKEQMSTLHVMANFDQFFSGTNSIDVKSTNNVTTGPAEEVAKLVENYSAGVFMVHHIETAE
jgi:hypothetical protein